MPIAGFCSSGGDTLGRKHLHVSAGTVPGFRIDGNMVPPMAYGGRAAAREILVATDAGGR